MIQMLSPMQLKRPCWIHDRRYSYCPKPGTERCGIPDSVPLHNKHIDERRDEKKQGGGGGGGGGEGGEGAMERKQDRKIF